MGKDMGRRTNSELKRGRPVYGIARREIQIGETIRGRELVPVLVESTFPV
jgi:hypothetical protein